MPGWRWARRHASHDHHYAEVRQSYGLRFYRLGLEMIREANYTTRCERRGIESPIWQQELESCHVEDIDDNKACDCRASYSFLIDQSTAEGDDKAAPMWRGYRRAGTFVYVTIGGVLSALVIAGSIFWAAA
ncbi:unnamed protein product [Vitrella brassicaformis CCMP3155]|uniref:Uncharacterized protein n=1 Tax=Vitrella brassicaformis (strain CCMP3155) TaxID=1169540 RepID=A0A0G4EKW1_VITBC|nr:unnamed protein product [Vitrella brassicaformis CCMP3155]|eukprot:CEL97811.1 unnamed protein product [Vitrella brassicaformis CCMP3155]